MSPLLAPSGPREAPPVSAPARTTSAACAPPERSFADVLAGRGGSAPSNDAAGTALLQEDALAAGVDGMASPLTGPPLGMIFAAPLDATPPGDTRPVTPPAEGPEEDEPHGTGEAAKPSRREDDGDPRDPTLLYPAYPLAPSLALQAAPPTNAAPFSPGPTLDELLPQLVRRIAWSGDGKKGAVRLELGAGALAGSTLLIEADDRDVRVHLTAPAGVDGAAWGERIQQRLTARGLHVNVEID